MFFFFNDTATTEIYTLSLHDALPIYPQLRAWLDEGLSIEVHTVDHPCPLLQGGDFAKAKSTYDRCVDLMHQRSEEHTSELQSRQYLVCRLLLEKKKKHTKSQHYNHV